MKAVKPAAWLGIFMLLSLTNGCTLNSDHLKNMTETESRTVSLGNAKEANVQIEIGAGELTLGGGARDLLDADFTYEKARQTPEIDYRVSDGHGDLSVRLAEGGRTEIRLKDNVPLGLEIKLGAGKSTLDVGSLALRKLAVNVGVGDCTVDLAGDWKEDLKASIKGGIGRATIRIPEDAGVRVRARGGIGEIRRGPLKQRGDAFVNEAYGKNPVTLDIEVEGGIGEIRIEESEGPAAN